MKKRIILSLSLWVSFSVLLVHADNFLCTCVSGFNGKRYLFNLSAKALTSAPQWKEGDDFPPLPPLKAREAALKKAKELCPSVGEWEATKISLEQIHQTYFSMPTFWIYLVACEDDDGPYDGPPRILEIPVMMSGLVIEPKIESNGH